MPSDQPTYAPMLAGTSPGVPSGDGWAYEIKWDGFRAIARVRGDDVQLLSRNGKRLDGTHADVAEALATILADPTAHDGRTYDLTGPVALGFAEAAQIASAATGRELRYVPETLEQARSSRTGQGEDWEVDAWISTYTAAAKGELEHVSGDVERLTGHPARDLATVLAGT